MPWPDSFWYQPVAWYKRYVTFCSWKVQSQVVSGNPGGENEVDVPETNHSKKASQGDHSGGHGGHGEDDEEVRRCGHKIIQTDTIVKDTKSSRRLLQSCQPFFLTRYQDMLLQQCVFPSRVSFEFSQNSSKFFVYFYLVMAGFLTNIRLLQTSSFFYSGEVVSLPYCTWRRPSLPQVSVRFPFFKLQKSIEKLAACSVG